jgi:two-component system phosphate regulon response regulator PhoB
MDQIDVPEATELNVTFVPHVVVVEDDPSISSLLMYNFEAKGYRVEIIDNGEQADQRLLEITPDLIVLDWMLPEVSGIELCRRIRARERTHKVPIIMLTARGEENERVRALSLGADDYVTKPFSVIELMARAYAVLRRVNPERVSSKIIMGDIELNRDEVRVKRDGKPVHLGPTEFKILEYFMERPARVLTRDQLIDGVWNSSEEIEERTVDVHIGRLRRALLTGRKKDPFRTVRGVGYSFEV